MKHILTIFFLSLSLQLSATNYYVKNGGNDEDTGADDAHAWATIAKVRATVLSAGDTVFFNRGDIWYVTSAASALVLDTYSGTKGVPIVYTAYGTGAKPIITARQSVTGWNTSGNWTDRGSNVWSMATDMIANVYNSNNRGRLWLNGTEVQKNNSTSAATSSFPWTHNGQTLYVYATSNPASYYSNIESCGSMNYALLCYEDNIVLSYLDIRGGGSTMHFYSVNNVTVDSCLIARDAGLYGFYINGEWGDADGTNNVVVTNCVLDTYDRFTDLYAWVNTEDGLYISDNCDSVQVYNCHLSSWGHTCLNIGLSSSSNTITNVKFHDNDLTNYGDYGRGFLYNLASGAEGTCTGNEIYNNLIHNTSAINQISGDGLRFYNNIIDTVRLISYVSNTANGGGLTLNGYAGLVENNEVYNNIIANCEGYGLLIAYSAQLITENKIINNLFYNNDEATGYQLYHEHAENAYSNEYRNNLFYKSGTTDLIWYGQMVYSYEPMTVAEFNAMDGSTTNMRPGRLPNTITNNITGEPLFTGGEPYDYTPTVGSPVISAGLGVGLTLDKAGNEWATSPSIGAYEYDSEPPDPPGLPEVTTTAITSYYSIVATGAGNVTSDGGGTITARGVCWGISANPTTSNSKFNATGTTGAFTGTMRGLTGGTTYHYRAFVTNESGTAYGEDREFTTPESSILRHNGKIVKYNGKIVVVR